MLTEVVVDCYHSNHRNPLPGWFDMRNESSIMFYDSALITFSPIVKSESTIKNIPIMGEE